MGITNTIIWILVTVGLIGGIFFVGIGTLIYYQIYKHIINRRLADGVTNKKPLPSPKWVAVILLIFHLVNLIPYIVAPIFTFEEREYERRYADEVLLLFSEDAEDFCADAETISNAQFEANSAVRNGIAFTYSTADSAGQSYYIAKIAPQQDMPADTAYEVEINIHYDEGMLSGMQEAAFTAEEFPLCVAAPFHEEDYDRKMVITIYALSEDGTRSFPSASTVILPSVE